MFEYIQEPEYCIEAAGNCSAVMCHAFQAQVFSHKDSALLYGDGSCFNAMVGITRGKVIFKFCCSRLLRKYLRIL